MGDQKMKKCKVCKKKEVYTKGICRSCLNGFSSKYSEKELIEAIERFKKKKNGSN